jgi:hypothetical protein
MMQSAKYFTALSADKYAATILTNFQCGFSGARADELRHVCM